MQFHIYELSSSDPVTLDATTKTAGEWLSSGVIGANWISDSDDGFVLLITAQNQTAYTAIISFVMTTASELSTRAHNAVRRAALGILNLSS